MRTVLVCVRTPLAAQSVASCAARLGVSTLRTAVSEGEALARLAEQPAELILADTALTRPDTVGFTRRLLAQAPQAVLVLFGAEEPKVAAAAVAAGARGLIRGGDNDLVGTVAKAVLLIGSARAATVPAPTVTTGGSGGSRHDGERAASSGGAGGSGGAGSGGAGRTAPVVADAVSANGTSGGAEHTQPDGADNGTTLVPVQRGDVTPAPPVTRSPMPGGRRRAPLTERELQVLRGMSDGKSNAEIGRDLYVSEDTVKTHARRLFRKLGARDRAHAVAVGFRRGALD